VNKHIIIYTVAHNILTLLLFSKVSERPRQASGTIADISCSKF